MVPPSDCGHRKLGSFSQERSHKKSLQCNHSDIRKHTVALILDKMHFGDGTALVSGPREDRLFARKSGKLRPSGDAISPGLAHVIIGDDGDSAVFVLRYLIDSGEIL